MIWVAVVVGVVLEVVGVPVGEEPELRQEVNGEQDHQAGDSTINHRYVLFLMLPLCCRRLHREETPATAKGVSTEEADRHLCTARELKVGQERRARQTTRKLSS